LMIFGKKDTFMDSLDVNDLMNDSFLRTIVSVMSQFHVLEAEDPDESSSAVPASNNALMSSLIKMFVGSQKESKSKWSAGVEEMMSYPEVTDEIAWLRHDGGYTSGFKFSHAFTAFVFTNVFGDSFLNNILPILEELLLGDNKTAEYKANLVTCAEIIAGVLRSVAMYENKKASAIVSASILPLVIASINEIGVVSGSCWLDAAKFSSSYGVSQLVWLNLILEQTEKQKVASTKVINYLKIVRVLIDELYQVDDIKSTLDRLSSCLRSLINYEFKAVRESAGVTLAVAIHKATRADVPIQSINKLLGVILGFEESGDKDTLYDSAFFLAGTLSTIGGYEETVAKLVPVLLQAIVYSDTEATKQFKSICTNIADSMEFGSLKMLKQIVSSGLSAPAWNVRLVSVQMMDALVKNQRAETGFIGLLICRKSLERMLYDDEVKVKQEAVVALRNLLSSLHPKSKSLSLYVTKYVELLRNMRTEKRKQKHQLPVVLGLSAAVKAFPYSVPSPQSVAALSRVKVKEAKTTIEEFKRTHHDTWDNDQQNFTPEELEDLMGSTEVYGYA